MSQEFEPKGFFLPILHAHLPFVRHPEFEDCLEEDWLFEAITESYLPLLKMLEGLEQDHCEYRLTMVFTPTLCCMLQDQLLLERYAAHLNKLLELTEKEVQRTLSIPEFHRVAVMYNEKIVACRDAFENRYSRNLLGRFRELQDAGHMEIMTCAATHAFLPTLRHTPSMVRAQIRIGRDSYEKVFGRPPRGIWLPECGFFPGLEEFLKEVGIRYFILDAHGVLFADRRPAYGVFAPIYTPSGVAAFGRDMESSRSVWSAEHGYPGDSRYREFYRDIGFDLDYDYIHPYIHESGLRTSTGLKYHRITGKVDLHEKEAYDPALAMEAAAQHAGNFMFNRQQQALHLSTLMDRPPAIVAPYDAELFGHWWYEGPDFLNFLLRKIAFDQEDIAVITPSEYLEKFPRNQVAMPAESSWGHKGYAEVWLDGSNDWIYRHLHKCAERMTDLAQLHRKTSGLKRRALNQAGRELLLAQASDWAFIMKTNTMVSYAIKRTRDHILNFTELYDQITGNTIDEKKLLALEQQNNIFPDMDYRVFA